MYDPREFSNIRQKSITRALVHIAAPCSENWDEMDEAKGGKFCKVCQNCVIDFTEKTNDEIIEILKGAKDKTICGRFYNTQVLLAGPSPELATNPAGQMTMGLPEIPFVVKADALPPLNTSNLNKKND